MKKLLIALAVVVLVVGGALFYVLANLNTYLNENRDWVAQQAGAALNREVSLGEIGISLSGGLGVRVEDLEIDDDPDFSEDAFVTADAIDLRVQLLPALFGNIEVNHVILRSPAITVVQTPKGLSTSTLGSGEPAEEEAPADAELPAFTIESIEVTDGTLRFIDKTASPAVETVVDLLDFTAGNVSLAGPIPFEVEAAVLGADRQNVRINGEVRNLQAPEADFTMTSSSLELEPAEGGSATALRDLEVDGSLSMPAAGPSVKATLRSPSGEFAGAGYGDLAIDFGMQDQIARIEKLSLGLFGGALDATGRYDMTNAARPRFELDSKLASMQLAKLAAYLSPKAEGGMEGALGGSLKVTGAGATWDEIRPGLDGHGNLTLTDGTIRDVNLAEATLGGITGVPGLSNLLPPELRKKYPQVFGTGDTTFEDMDAKLDIEDGEALLRDFQLAARDYTLTGNGTYGLDNDLDLSTVMTFSEALSASLLEAAEPMKYLRTPEGRVALPVTLTGAFPRIKPVPDVSYVAKAASREAVGSLLDKALGTQKKPAGTQGAESGKATDGQPEQPSPESEAIRRGIDSLFGQ